MFKNSMLFISLWAPWVQAQTLRWIFFEIEAYSPKRTNSDHKHTPIKPKPNHKANPNKITEKQKTQALQNRSFLIKG